jgi:hypothetical protein
MVTSMKKPEQFFSQQSKAFGNGLKDNTHKIFCVLTQASCCTTWVLGDWPMFGDGPVFLSTFVGTVSVLFRHTFL